ncbi:AlbA family DNA-binding domain-containing protein [Tropicimonas marinistellae]|uniref:AlbA family DNA-binding domain-containing protein n=1 Tax=Tropicimonas marinistellae TaxID=1739787 RepID=UPI00082C4FF2|nr:RNA-binding domain-containing protein [Tropicimonas marinistellae]
MPFLQSILGPGTRPAGAWFVPGLALLGAVFGFLVLHPLVLSLVWIEFSRSVDGVDGYGQFMLNHANKLTEPSNIGMGLAFAAIGAAMGWGFGLIARAQIRREADLRVLSEVVGDSIPDLIAGGESARVEFKSSMRWDVRKGQPNKALEMVIAKTIAGFLNSKGGTLLIGVTDEGAIHGLESDYATLRSKDRDGFELLLRDILKRFLGGHVSPHVHSVFSEVEGLDVCLVIVEPAPKPVYLTQGGKAEFLIRSGNSTRALDVRETMDYAAERWPE